MAPNTEIKIHTNITVIHPIACWCLFSQQHLAIKMFMYMLLNLPSRPLPMIHSHVLNFLIMLIFNHYYEDKATCIIISSMYICPWQKVLPSVTKVLEWLLPVILCYICCAKEVNGGMEEWMPWMDAALTGTTCTPSDNHRSDKV